MPSDTRNRSPSPPSRGTAGIDRHNRSRSPKRHQKEGADSPAEVHRYRSRSPRPRSPPADEEAKPRTKKSASGFKFKERTTGEGHHDKDKDRGHMTKGLERGYRDKGGEGKFRPSAHSSDAVSEKFGVDASVKDKFGDVKVPEVSGNSITGDKPAEAKREKRKEKSKPSVAQPALEMIVVYVNDRLGTRAQIMCSPSDTISRSSLAHYDVLYL